MRRDLLAVVVAFQQFKSGITATKVGSTKSYVKYCGVSPQTGDNLTQSDLSLLQVNDFNNFPSQTVSTAMITKEKMFFNDSSPNGHGKFGNLGMSTYYLEGLTNIQLITIAELDGVGTLPCGNIGVTAYGIFLSPSIIQKL